MVRAEGGVNYHEVLLAKQSTGPIRGQDIYLYLTGEFMSETLRRLYIAAAANESRGFLARLTGRESTYAKHLSQIQQMNSAIAQGHFRQALQVYEQLPDELKNDKTFLLLRLRAAQTLGDAEYQSAIDALHQLYPDDRSADLLSIDGHVMRKNYAKALDAIDRVDKAVGGDPYLEVVRANTYLKAGDLRSAQQCAGKAIEQDASLEDAYWALVTIGCGRLGRGSA
jgi:tetratricopeptide (TPR) repeat protein